jgi:hypothetical protein
LGREAPLNLMLARALYALKQRELGFAVPNLYATYCFGEKLLFDCAPARIELRLVDWISDGQSSFHSSDYFLSAGDWGPISRAIMLSTVATEAVELYKSNLVYQSTDSYAGLIRAVERGKPLKRQHILLDQKELIDQYFQRFVALFRSIQEQGMISVSLLRSRGQATTDELNVGVAIGPGGQLYRLPGGQHRTAIAKVLGLPSMPVEVRLIHTIWLSEVMSKTGSPPTNAIRKGIDQDFRYNMLS